MFSCRPNPSCGRAENGDNLASMVYATKDGSTFRTTSFWPERGVIATEDPTFHRRWLDCLLKSPNGCVHLHPDLTIPAGKDADAPLVYTRRTGLFSEAAPFTSLAVLGSRNRRINIVPKIPLRVSIRERYLMADQVLGENSTDALAPFLNAVCQVLRAGEADWIFFDDVEVGSPLWNRLAELDRAPGVAVFYPNAPQPRWRLRFPPKGEDIWKQFASRTRETFRRRLRKLSHQLRCYREPSEVGPFLEKAHEISRKSWQSKYLGLRITADDQQRQWWEQIAALGAMRSYILEHDGAPVAFELSTQWNGLFLGEETGFDQDYARYSPGTVMFLRMIEDLLEQDTPRLLDFTWGDAEYKETFSNERTLSGRVLLVRRAFKPMLAVRLRQLGQTMSRFVRAGLNWTPRLGRVLRKLRHS